MIQKKSSRTLWQLTLAAMLGLLAVNGLVFVALTWPRLNRARRAQGQVAALQQQLVAERAESERLRKRAQAIQANVRDAKRFLSEMTRPMPEALATDLEAVENAVRTSGLSLDRRGYGQQAVRGAPLLRYTIRLPLSGARAQTGFLLRQLERSPRFIIVDRVDVQDDRETGQARLDVELSTYYQNDEAAPPKAMSKRAATTTKDARRR
jgi:Tfp pilus assembly protein PilO